MPSPSYIDAHCHLSDPRLSADPEAFEKVLQRSRDAGVGQWILGGVDPADWDRQEKLASLWPDEIIPCFGLHPWWVRERTKTEIDLALQELEKRANRAAGIGELGLDFHPEHRAADKQLHAFESQLRLACRLNKPLVLHIVKAHGPALDLLKRIGVPHAGGLVHSFSGGPEIARQYVDLGLTLSISGVIARKGFESLKRAVVRIPPESLVVETDSPDQPVHPGLNEPAYLIGIAQAVASFRNEDPKEILERSAENLRGIFGLRK